MKGQRKGVNADGRRHAYATRGAAGVDLVFSRRDEVHDAKVGPGFNQFTVRPYEFEGFLPHLVPRERRVNPGVFARPV